MMITMLGGWVFLLVPAHPGSAGQRAVKRSLLLLLSSLEMMTKSVGAGIHSRERERVPDFTRLQCWNRQMWQTSNTQAHIRLMLHIQCKPLEQMINRIQQLKPLLVYCPASHQKIPFKRKQNMTSHTCRPTGSRALLCRNNIRLRQCSKYFWVPCNLDRCHNKS